MRYWTFLVADAPQDQEETEFVREQIGNGTAEIVSDTAADDDYNDQEAM